MLEDVAVEDPQPREVVEPHGEAHRLTGSHVEGVLPGAEGLGGAAVVEELELDAVRVEGVVHVPVVGHAPDLVGAGLGSLVDARVVKRPAVDAEVHVVLGEGQRQLRRAGGGKGGQRAASRAARAGRGGGPWASRCKKGMAAPAPWTAWWRLRS